MPFSDLPQPFLRAEALAHDVSSRRIDNALLRGDLDRIAPGVYAVSSQWTPLEPWKRHLALARAAVRTTPDAIVSHASAAALLGLPMPPKPPERATMTVLDDGRTSEDDGWRRFHRGRTPPEQIVIDEGNPYLVPARTVVDCMREMRPGDALAVLDAAIRAGLVTGSELTAMRRHQRRWPGIPQVVVSDSLGRFVARVDVLWQELGVVGEADGRGKYLTDTTDGSQPSDEEAARAVVAQAIRESRVRDLGLEVVRWDPPDLGQPLGLLGRFHAAVARARPELVTARFTCSCCRRPLTDCGSPTRIAGLRAA